MFEYLESISITEGEQIKKTIQALFRQTCILQVKYDPATLVPKDNVQYEICVRHRHFIEDYLSVLGCELTHDAQEHIFCLTGDGAAREKLNMTETVILLIIIDHSGFDGQMSLMEDEFFRKYERKIGLLTEKFMPSREEDGAGREKHKNEMERFADYRNYLDFNMYEQSIDENGIEKKNYVDDMAGVDSGGEGQNPKYVALLAGFAMLYMQQSNRDSKIRLVLLDEAFSKMDKERSEVCLKYARELELQLIVCVPDERLQSLIRNVDSVYGFRRFRNQVTMMHIDKGNYLDMIAGESRSEEV